MSTESVDPRYALIDTLDAYQVVHLLDVANHEAADAVGDACTQIADAARAMANVLWESSSGRVIGAGAGTAGRKVIADMAEWSPTFGWEKNRTLRFMAGGDKALVESVEGAEDSTALAKLYFRRHHTIGSNDVLIAVAASGKTPFTVECLHLANECGALTIGIANNQGTPLLKYSQCPILLDTGPEPIAGSTRMKAGSAQEAALKILSTTVMTRLGYVYRGEMIRVRPSNQKLKKRAVLILQRLTKKSAEEAVEALNTSSWDVQVALFLLKGFDLRATHDALEFAHNDTRVAEFYLES